MKCSSNKCENPAIYRYCWTDFKYACEPCMQKVLAAAEVMGFSTPASTVELLPEPQEKETVE